MMYETLKSTGALTVTFDGRLGWKPNKNITKKQIDETLEYMKANKAAIIAEYNAEKAAEKKQQEEDEAATVKFYNSGWEAHTIKIDTRKDIDGQLKKYAEMYSDDCTYDSLKADYDKAASTKAEAAEVERQEEIELYRSNIAAAGKSKIYDTKNEAEAASKAYNDLMNEGGDGYTPRVYYKAQVDTWRSRLAKLEANG